MTHSTSASDYDDVVPIFLTFGALSVVFCGMLLWLSYKNPRLREPPSNIVIIISVCDMVFAFKFFVGAMTWKLGGLSAQDKSRHTDSFRFIPDDCLTESIFANFFGVALVSWNAAWVLNFTLELYNPLRSTRPYHRFYHAVCWSWALFSTALIVLNKQYGVTSDATCWVTAGSPYAAWIFDFPCFLVVISIVASLVYAVYRLQVGSENTRELRINLMKRHAVYVCIFVLCWLWPLLHRRVHSTGKYSAFLYLDAIGVTSQAFLLSLSRILQREVRVCLAQQVPWLWKYAPLPKCLRGDVVEGDLDLPLMADSGSGLADQDSDVIVGFGALNLKASPGLTPKSAGFSARTCRLPPGIIRLSGSSPVPSADSVATTPRTPRQASAAFGVSEQFREEISMTLLEGVTTGIMLQPGTEGTEYVPPSPLLPGPRPMKGFRGVSDGASTMSTRSDLHGGIPSRIASSISLGVRDSATDPGAGQSAPASPSSGIVAGDRSASEAGLLPSGRQSPFVLNLASARPDLAIGITRSRSSMSGLKVPRGNDLSTRLPGGGTVKVLAPEAFAHIRSLFGIEPHAVAEAFDPRKLAAGTISAHFSEAKSASFFCESDDGRFILKTMSSTEVQSLLSFLPSYTAHLEEFPGSLLSLFFGIFCVRHGRGSATYAVLMGNVFAGAEMDEMYDLKGSTYHRQAGEATLAGSLADPDSPAHFATADAPTPAVETKKKVLMDVDFLTIRGEHSLRLGPEASQQVLIQIGRDVALLKEHRFMDYSILLGIAKPKTPAVHDRQVARGGPSGGLAGAAAGGTVGREEEIGISATAGGRAIRHAQVEGSGAAGGGGGAAADNGVRTHSEIPGMSHSADVLATPVLPSSSSTRGIRSPPADEQPTLPMVHRLGFPSRDADNKIVGDEVYYLAVIDVLQTYTIQKRLEHHLKSFSLRTWDSPKISSTDCERYGSRFLEFVQKLFR